MLIPHLLLLVCTALLQSPVSGRLFFLPQRGSRTSDAEDLLPATVTPFAVAASHNHVGFGPECAVDGKDHTFWLVSGGVRMEMMSRDKWIVLDLGTERQVSAISLRGKVDTFSPARVLLDASDSPDGPWRRVDRFRALGSPMRWQRIELPTGPHASRFFRFYVRREGHASFRHALHGILFHCADREDDAAAAAA